MSRNTQLYLVFALLFLSVKPTAQVQQDQQVYNDAVDFMTSEQYELAVDAFSFLPDYKDSNYRSVICALLSQKFKNTPIEKLMVFEDSPESGALFYYWLGRIQLKRFKLAEAEASFNKFLNEAHYAMELDVYKQETHDKLALIKGASDRMKILPMESPINSRYADIPGALLGDGDRLIFMSDRNSDGQFEIFKTDKGAYGWGTPEVISKTSVRSDILNVLNVKESLVLIDPDQQHLYTVEWTDNGMDVTEGADVPFLKEAKHIYVNDYQSRIIFSMKNEAQGLDLYETIKLRSTGEWLEPSLVGGQLNSAYDEDYPFLRDDRKRLYFSSNRPGGLGKSDIYYVEMDNETNLWGKPVNAGIPVNSVDDDISFSMTSDSQAMISSDRIYSSGGLDLFVVEVDN